MSLKCSQKASKRIVQCMIYFTRVNAAVNSRFTEFDAPCTDFRVHNFTLGVVVFFHPSTRVVFD